MVTKGCKYPRGETGEEGGGEEGEMGEVMASKGLLLSADSSDGLIQAIKIVQQASDDSFDLDLNLQSPALQDWL